MGFFVSLAYFVSPDNSHCCYPGNVECIFSCMYFCEHIIREKKLNLVTPLFVQGEYYKLKNSRKI